MDTSRPDHREELHPGRPAVLGGKQPARRLLSADGPTVLSIDEVEHTEIFPAPPVVPGLAAVAGEVDLFAGGVALLGGEHVQSAARIGEGPPGAAAVFAGVEETSCLGQFPLNDIFARHSKIADLTVKRVRRMCIAKGKARSAGFRRQRQGLVFPGQPAVVSNIHIRLGVRPLAVGDQPGLGVPKAHPGFAAALQVFALGRAVQPFPGSATVAGAVEIGIIVAHPRPHGDGQPAVFGVAKGHQAWIKEFGCPRGVQPSQSSPGSPAIGGVPHHWAFRNDELGLVGVGHPSGGSVQEEGHGSLEIIRVRFRRGDVSPGFAPVARGQDVVVTAGIPEITADAPAIRGRERLYFRNLRCRA